MSEALSFYPIRAKNASDELLRLGEEPQVNRAKLADVIGTVDEIAITRTGQQGKLQMVLERIVRVGEWLCARETPNRNAILAIQAKLEAVMEQIQ